MELLWGPILHIRAVTESMLKMMAYPEVIVPSFPYVGSVSDHVSSTTVSLTVIRSFRY